MRVLAAVLLWLIIAFSIVMMWDQAHWAISIPEIGTFALASLLLLGCAAGWQRPEVSPIILPLLAVALWGLLQMWLGDTVYGWRTKVAVLYWSANLAVFFAALQVFANSRARRGFLDALLVLGFVMAIVSPLQSLDPQAKIFWLIPVPENLHEVFGPFPYRNQYAAFVELLLPYAIYRAVTSEKRTLIYALMVAVLYASVIASASRMGFFLTTVEMIAVPALVMWRRGIPFRRVQSGAFFFAAILIMLAVAAGPNIVASKFSENDPYAGRREYTEASIAMIKDRPLLGYGLGTWSTVYPEYALVDDGLFINQAHDDWAQWAAEGGLPFMGLMLALALWSVRRGWATGWGLGVAAVFVHCFVDYPIQRMGVGLVMFTMMAAMASAEGVGRADNSKPV